MEYNYAKLLQDGKDYEEFVVKTMLAKRNIKLDIFRTLEQQFYVGESAQGYEIKLDRNFRKTGNLYLEVGEKKPSADVYIDSGILRKDNTVYYLIGDYSEIFILSKRQLRSLFHDGTLYRQYNTHMGETSMGFLLNFTNSMTDFLIIDNILVNGGYEYDEQDQQGTDFGNPPPIF